MINHFKFIFLVLTAFLITSCKKAIDGNAPGMPPIASPTAPLTPLSITPVTTILAINNNFNFTATGGTALYNFSIVSGGGIILTVADVGQFTAPATAGMVTIQLTDSNGGLVTANVTVNAALQISPISQTIMTNAALNISASGWIIAVHVFNC